MAGLIKRLVIGENVDNRIVKLPYLVLAISIIFTLGVTVLFYKNAVNKDNIKFNTSVSRVHSNLENKLNLYIALLKGGRGFIESTKDLNREKFANYIKSLELEKNYAGVMGIGFSKIVLPNEREALIKRMKSENYPDFNIFPEGERDFYQAILYLEPLEEKNQKVIGYDMSTEFNRRQALDRARDSGTEALTSKVVLMQENETGKQPGFLIYLPIYKDGKVPPTLSERRQNLVGYIYSPFQAEDS